MHRDILPDSYRGVSDDELKGRIAAHKKRLGTELCILGHYYQQSDVVAFADHQGDSFALANAGSGTKARWIVFCGVHFMAEGAVILAKPRQRVFLPDMDAGCPLADMAGIDEVKDAWLSLEDAGAAKDFIPIVYMNSTADLKAFCGKHGGLVCTSSSAGQAFDWAFKQGRRVFFFPDENLGRNTANKKGVAEGDVAIWDPARMSDAGCAKRVGAARVVVWKGFCHVHTYFSAQHVEEARARYPGCKIVVHPECDPKVVALADGEGSTAWLKKFAEEAPAGSTVVVGTEINLVARLAAEHPEKKIVPLARSLCPNMFKISLADLCWTLGELGNVNEVFVEEVIARDAKVALDRMLALKV